MLKLWLLILAIQFFLPIVSLAAEFNREASIKRLKDAQHEIEALNRNLSCKKNSDCDVIEMGHALCGGPGSYLTVSKRNSHLQEIEKKAVIYSGLQAEFQREHEQGLAGVCVDLEKPTLICVKRKCAQKKSL